MTERVIDASVAIDIPEWVRGVQCVSVQPVSHTALELSNPLDRELRDFTVLLPGTVTSNSVRWNGAAPRGTCSWGDWLCAWNDLPAGGSAVVRWGRHVVRPS